MGAKSMSYSDGRKTGPPLLKGGGDRHSRLTSSVELHDVLIPFQQIA